MKRYRALQSLMFVGQTEAIEEHPEGDYVLYDDVQKLVEALKESLKYIEWTAEGTDPHDTSVTIRKQIESALAQALLICVEPIKKEPSAIEIEIDPVMPPDEVHFVDRNGAVVGKIKGLKL